MSVNFPKDAWIKDAIAKRYLIVHKNGTIERANKATKEGVVDVSAGYHLVKYQTHKKSGRVFFNMTWRGFKKSVLVNRVVALRYLPNPLNLPQVNHIDGDKQNNALENPDGTPQLEWSSGSDNEKHAHQNGLKSGRGSQNSNAKLTAADVEAIRSCIGCSVRELADKYGVGRSTITNIISGKSWNHI
ncbi:hypothetical protein FHV99_004592 [Ochrobactrum sp. P20RRXII]|nr:HNH endonuclease [Ochrobactrum sp. P20RRXII]NIH77340.1 hypothetical protein [Ochrobactrum sp. P20RRXII]